MCSTHSVWAKKIGKHAFFSHDLLQINFCHNYKNCYRFKRFYYCQNSNAYHSKFCKSNHLCKKSSEQKNQIRLLNLQASIIIFSNFTKQQPDLLYLQEIPCFPTFSNEPFLNGFAFRTSRLTLEFSV